MLGISNLLPKRLTPSHKAIISDILLWFAMALTLVLLFYLLTVRLPERRGQTIHLSFRDANEITVGSAVHMMGMEIGYVSDMRILKDRVHMTLRIDPGVPSIPSGSAFTILFTGLAGAKSIEVSLPEVPGTTIQGKPIYLVEEPVRMKDTLNYTTDITRALQKGAENIADFFGKKKPVEELQFNIQQAHRWMNESVAYTTALNRDIRAIHTELHTSAQEGLRNLHTFQGQVQSAIHTTQPGALRPQISSFFTHLSTLENLVYDQATHTTKTPRLIAQLGQFNAQTANLGHWLRNANEHVAGFPFVPMLEKFERGEDTLLTALDRTQHWFTGNPQAKLHRARKSIQNFNAQLVRLQQKVDGATPATPSVTPCPTASCPPANQPYTAQAPQPSQSLVIVDRYGNPITTTQSPWWEQTPAAQKTPPSALRQSATTPAQSPALPVRLFQSFQNGCRILWDAVRSFFQ